MEDLKETFDSHMFLTMPSKANKKKVRFKQKKSKYTQILEKKLNRMINKQNRKPKVNKNEKLNSKSTLRFKIICRSKTN